VTKFPERIVYSIVTEKDWWGDGSGFGFSPNSMENWADKGSIDYGTLTVI
jgi:hypothetical protein